MQEAQNPQVRKTREQRQKEFEQKCSENSEFKKLVEERRNASMQKVSLRQESVQIEKEKGKKLVQEMQEQGIHVEYLVYPKDHSNAIDYYFGNDADITRGALGYQIAGGQDSSLVMNIAHCFCSKQDQFSKHKARLLIQDRLSRLPEKYTTSISISEEIANNGEICSKIASSIVKKKFYQKKPGTPN